MAKDLKQQELTTINQADHPINIVVISRAERSLHRITLSDAETLAANGIAPPTCGTCQHFNGSSLLQVGMCREHRAETHPGELSCTRHRWQPGHARLAELVEDLRRHPGRAFTLKAIEFEYPKAEPADVEYFEAAERGERGAVALVGMSTEPPPIKRVNMGTHGERYSVAWQPGEGHITHRRPELLPVAELATC